MAYVHKCVEEMLVKFIISRYPKANGYEDVTWYNGACEIQFYPYPTSEEPYAAIYKNGSCYILKEF